MKKYIKAYIKSNILLIIVSLVISYICYSVEAPVEKAQLEQHIHMAHTSARVHSS
jgi:hypothetical protein